MARRGETKLQPRLVDQHKRVVLPKEVLEALSLDSGDHVAFAIDGKRVEIRKVNWTVA